MVGRCGIWSTGSRTDTARLVRPGLPTVGGSLTVPARCLVRLAPERGSKARRYFSVTPLGVKALKAMHASLASLSKGLEAVLEQP